MLVTMSDKELSRINVIQSVVEKRMRRRDAAHQLAMTEHQTQRLMNRFRESGATGLANQTFDEDAPVGAFRTGIELICANSLQAKGRVERANQTLQRLEGISSIKYANAWLYTFIIDFNRRFVRPENIPKDLHRPVAESADFPLR